jgi:hypothetical protein
MHALDAANNTRTPKLNHDQERHLFRKMVASGSFDNLSPGPIQIVLARNSRFKNKIFENIFSLLERHTCLLLHNNR